MNTMTIRFISLWSVAVVLVSCIVQSTLNGFWQSSEEFGTIEFKETGEVIIVDNMSATMTGHYEIEGDDLIKFELTASDILRESVQPMPKTVVTAKIVKFKGDELQLQFVEKDTVIHFRRIH